MFKIQIKLLTAAMVLMLCSATAYGEDQSTAVNAARSLLTSGRQQQQQQPEKPFFDLTSSSADAKPNTQSTPNYAPATMPGKAQSAVQTGNNPFKSQAAPNTTPPMPTVGNAPAAPTATTSHPGNQKISRPATALKDSPYSQNILDSVSTLQDAHVLPEIPTVVELSRSDANRINCYAPIKDIVYSEERGLKIRFSGPDAYLKYQTNIQDGSAIYSKVPIDIHVSCGGQVFTLIAQPVVGVARTVRLVKGTEKIQANAALYDALPLEGKIRKIMQALDDLNIPESYTIKKVGLTMSVFKDLDIRYTRNLIVEGEGLIVREYLITLTTANDLELNEYDFLRKEFCHRPIALHFVDPKIAKGLSTRLYIIEPSGVAAAAAAAGGNNETGQY